LLRPDQRIARLYHRLEELALWTVVRAEAIPEWRFNGAVVGLGDAWPTRDGVVRLEHGPVEVPREWSLERTRLDLDLGGEGLVRIAYASGGQDAFGLDPNHRRFVLRERSFSIGAECVARLPFGVPNREARLARARLIEIDLDLEEFILLLRQVAETAHELAGHDAVLPLLAAAEEALARLNWPSATSGYVARVAPGAEMQKVWELPPDLDPAPAALDETARTSVQHARTTLIDSLRRIRETYPQQGALAVTGHAHIDLAWLWPLQETRRKANRTFHTMIGLMERYPDFRFNQSTAQLYAFLEEDDPELFASIEAKVKAGQWETIGGMWVEPDTNMPTGESLVRQILYGQRYFQRHFGQRHTVCWLPDCFGFSPALPQLLKLAGMEHFFTIKVNWSETNKFPHDLFWWEGLDGSRVLAHTFDNPVGGYNAETSPRAVIETWRNFRGKHRYGESLFSFGFGDGGGGPTEEMLERQRQMEDFPVLPAMRPVTVEDWFRRAQQAAAQDATTPVWTGEIYLELHRGTLSTQGRTKYLHRRAERALITAEALGCMALFAGGSRPASLEDHWRVLLRNEFHDILPGSSIREVYELAEQELGSVVEAGTQQSERHLEALAGKLVQPGTEAGLLVINPDCSPRPLRIQSPEPLPGGQPVESGSVLCATRTVPGLSAAVVLAASPPAGLSVSPQVLENELVRVQLAPDGTLASLFDKRAGREVLEGRGNQIWAYTDKPRNWDAWDIEEDFWRQGEELAASEPPEVVERGPHRAAIRIVRDYRSSRIVQTIRLWANSARIEFKTDIDWHDRRLLLKARFPLAIRSEFATFECAHGVVRRSTLRNTSWDEAQFEVAGHRFADLSEHGYGAALLNDGKYGHHAVGNELGLTLLRSPVFPDPLADEGQQSFTYALLPHEGDWLSGGVLAEAEDLNQPLLHRAVSAGSESHWQAIAVGGPRLGLSALKPTEEGEGVLLRLYEPAGARGHAEIGLPDGWELQSAVDLLEQPIEGVDTFFRPFQLRGWTLRRA
jgi:alpha-mannosidase